MGTMGHQAHEISALKTAACFCNSGLAPCIPILTWSRKAVLPAGRNTMKTPRVFNGVFQLFKFISDPEFYCLIWIAARNGVKRTETSSRLSVQEKKSAGAASSR